MIAAIRGTHDILPGEVDKWQYVERYARTLCERYGYAELRTPVIEREELFAKGTGESTDIVQKEMYAFTDKGGERVTLRPEATPSMVRAYIEHNLEHTLPAAKLYAMGPMFRYERPQKGRYRQFHQLDVEVFGMEDPAVDAEVIDLAWSLVTGLGIAQAELVVNSVGCPACRPAFQQALLAALGDNLAKLCGDCQRRSATNPLRIYDCKVPADQPIIDGLPHSVDYLCDACATHFAGVKSHLDAIGIPWTQSHRLVRGLDYYVRTTFEVLGQALGAQNALLGGGRYDGLVKKLGGADKAAIGFAAGLERLVLALPESAPIGTPARAFIVAIGEDGRAAAWTLLRALRQAGVPAQMELEARGVRSQFKRADRLAARVTLIVGGDELARGEVTLRDMATGEQRAIARDAVVTTVRDAVASTVGNKL
ncbi:MAG: histidine--tRNA ligase [Acidobacteria bacterium]|nr:histidine--tRNA ligase [Acidobacteriota bacterium]